MKAVLLIPCDGVCRLLRIEEELGANAIYGGEYFEFEESENEF